MKRFARRFDVRHGRRKKRKGFLRLRLLVDVMRIRSQGSKAWREMLLMHRRGMKPYRKRYHRRSLAETAISTVKRRFGHTSYSKKRRGEKNTLRLKVMTRDLTVIAAPPAQCG
jgi:transposase